MTMATTAIPIRFPFFLASNIAVLHHINSKGKTIKMGENEKKKETPTGFLERNDEDRQRRALISLLFPSSPSPSLLWCTAKGWQRR
jgi:hypothetical protein